MLIHSDDERRASCFFSSRDRFALDFPNTVWFPPSDLELVSREQLVGNGCTFSSCEPVCSLLK